MADQRAGYGVRKLTLACSEHGLLHEATVICQHEYDDTIRSVQNAHGSTYGGGCADGVLHVELTHV